MVTRTDGAQLAWTLDSLEHALEVYCAEVEAADLAADTKRTYIRHATTFVRWIAGDFTPGSGP
jgi:hypothetical protein